MKIIRASNYDSRAISDTIIAENIHNYYAKFIATVLNRAFSGDTETYFFKVVANDYELYIARP